MQPVGLLGDLREETAAMLGVLDARRPAASRRTTLMTDRGVFSSCETLATKSCRICSASFTSVVSSRTITAPALHGRESAIRTP